MNDERECTCLRANVYEWWARSARNIRYARVRRLRELHVSTY